MYSKNDRVRLYSDRYVNSSLEVEEYRSEYRRDIDRLIHSPSFRRLQGKTQLYPGKESDFFRNRLTHSLEVAQIAKSIAIRLNNRELKEKENLKIDLDIVEFAGLAHDLGHPPFGHQGEAALNQLMANQGGFEGNAQTLRLLTRIEKKNNVGGILFERNGKEFRQGLNLTSRTIASILKYDNVIPVARSKTTKFIKGYYESEKDIVESVKHSVLRGHKISTGDFKTVECQIMDIADDIAYSTYDLEDALKAGFVNPFDIVFCKPEIADKVTGRINESIKKQKKEDTIQELTTSDLKDIYLKIFEDCFATAQRNDLDPIDSTFQSLHILETGVAYNFAKQLSKDGAVRTDFTSKLIGRFIRGVKLHIDKNHPPLSKVSLINDIWLEVEALKHFNYVNQISSPKLKIVEYRGKEIVKKIFTILSDKESDGYLLMPKDYIALYEAAPKKCKLRVICDFIAGMTDSYCIGFYGRLTSENPETIFKPL